MFLLNQSTHRMLVRYHPHIGHLYVPNLRARIPNENGGYFVTTNALGFRSDIEYKRERSHLPRILFFGDSYTAGDNCENSDRFSDRVGDMLGAEVYNYGLSGSGTDQHLLIYEQFARDVEADLIVLCVQADSIRRIQVGHRESIDRTTGQKVLVPKPYFLLEGEKLVLHNVPVTRERPEVGSVDIETLSGNGAVRQGRMRSLLNRYRTDPRLEKARKLVRSRLARLQSEVYRLSRMQPYEEYRSEETLGWRLMRAIIRRFVERVAPIPVLIVPIPTYEFTRHGVEPIYQPLFNKLADPQLGVSVLDISTPLRQPPWKVRQQLAFRYDTHFSPFGHQRVAELIAQKIKGAGLLGRIDTAREGGLAPKAERSRSSRKASAGSLYVLGLSCFYHNSAACLVKDGQIVAAAEEERFTRVKSDRRFPHQAVNYCLEEGGINQKDLAAVVYYDNPYLTFERLLHSQLAIAETGEEQWLRFLPSWIRYKLHLPQLIRSHLRYDGTILQNCHHRSHAASAFYPSPYERAAILTLDGVGEWATATIGVGSGSHLDMLKEMRFPHSLGLLYSAFTQFTGFKVNSGEYKMMGLAPYGEPKYVDAILNNLVQVKEDGSVELNLKYFGFLSQLSMTNDRFAELFGGPARSPEARITRREMDIARSIQVVTETVVLRMAQHAHELTGEKKLCLAGGVALNCVANGRLLREGPFEDIWIQPAAGDAGSAIGAALDVYHNVFRKPRIIPGEGRSLQDGSLLGPQFSDDEIRAFLDTHGYPYQELSSHARGEVLANLLREGKVIGHFAGRMEFGPRSLGARSIIGDARNQGMQVNLNLKIKYRESFRPFAPSVLVERVEEYFELDRPSPYMLVVAPVKKERRLPLGNPNGEDLLEIVRCPRSDIPAVTHVDYSARIQTVDRRDHPLYYDLIREFEKLTSYGVIVNTSFNVRGEPIVCTPYDAYRCFMRTEMEALSLGNFLLLKDKQPFWPESKGHLETNEGPAEVDEDTALMRQLRKVYKAVFVPLAKRLGVKHLNTDFVSNGSTWETCSNIDDPFSIPKELDVPSPDPEMMTAAMVRYFAPGEVRERLKPLLIDLIALGLRHSSEEELIEEVPDSVYVVF